MYYQLPPGTSSVAVGAVAFEADALGRINVPDNADAAVLRGLQDPFHLGLKPAANQSAVPPEVPAEPPVLTFVKNASAAAAVGDADAEKKHIRDFLKQNGVRHDGRGTLDYLRTTVGPLVESLLNAVRKGEDIAAEDEGQGAAGETGGAETSGPAGETTQGTPAGEAGGGTAGADAKTAETTPPPAPGAEGTTGAPAA